MKNWKKILSVSLAASMMLTVAACGSSSTTTTEADVTTETGITTETAETEVVVEDEEIVETTGGPSEEIISASILDNMVQVGSVTGVNGELPASALTDLDCTLYYTNVSSSSTDVLTEDYLVYGGESKGGIAYFEGGHPGIDTDSVHYGCRNTSESSISLKDCALTITKVFYDTETTSDVPIYFAGGIGAGSTLSDVKEALGEPDIEDEADDYLIYTYYGVDEEKDIEMQVSFDRNTSTVAVIYVRDYNN
ncbi:MAG: hypothetical protein LUE14_05130 [Clostridiales bacterium]|nr:hypothetical protein [Clostridiales bacterium]